MLYCDNSSSTAHYKTHTLAHSTQFITQHENVGASTLCRNNPGVFPGKIRVDHRRHRIFGQSAHRKTVALVSRYRRNLPVDASEEGEESGGAIEWCGGCAGGGVLVILLFEGDLVGVLLQLFNRLKKERPDAIGKIKIVTGDVSVLGLGKC